MKKMDVCVNTHFVFHNSWILAALYMTDIYFSQKLFLNAKETDEIPSKKEEGTLLESEVRRKN